MRVYAEKVISKVSTVQEQKRQSFFLSQLGINCLRNNDLQLSQSICGSNKRDMMMMNTDNILSHGSSPLDNLECIMMLQRNPDPFLGNFYSLLFSFAHLR